MGEVEQIKKAKSISQLEKLKAQAGPREANLFYSLCENDQNTIDKTQFKQALFDAGLSSLDYRLKSLFERLEKHGDQINFEEFMSFTRTGGLLAEKALRGELAVPDFRDFSRNLDKIYDEVLPNRSGDLARYIPPLAEVDPEQFGIAVVTTDCLLYTSPSPRDGW